MRSAETTAAAMMAKCPVEKEKQDRESSTGKKRYLPRPVAATQECAVLMCKKKALACVCPRVCTVVARVSDAECLPQRHSHQRRTRRLIELCLQQWALGKWTAVNQSESRHTASTRIRCTFASRRSVCLCDSVCVCVCVGGENAEARSETAPAFSPQTNSSNEKTYRKMVCRTLNASSPTNLEMSATTATLLLCRFFSAAFMFHGNAYKRLDLRRGKTITQKDASTHAHAPPATVDVFRAPRKSEPTKNKNNKKKNATKRKKDTSGNTKRPTRQTKTQNK